MAILVNKARVCVNIGATPLMTAQVLSVDALDSQLPPLHVSTQQHSEISLDFSKSPCRHLSLPALFAGGEYLYSVFYHYPHGIRNKFPRSGKCFYEWHNRAYLSKASQRPGSGSIFLRESHNRISLLFTHELSISVSVKVTPGGFPSLFRSRLSLIVDCRHTNPTDQLETCFEENNWRLLFTSNHALDLSQSLHFVTLFWVNLLFGPLL